MPGLVTSAIRNFFHIGSPRQSAGAAAAPPPEHALEPLGPGLDTLMAAAADGNPERVSTLLRSGIPVDQQDTDGRTALSIAAAGTSSEILDLLADNGADIDHQDRRCGYTPLMFAVMNGSQECARRLIARHAKLELKDSEGRTALALASQFGEPECARMLLEAGANLESRT